MNIAETDKSNESMPLAGAETGRRPRWPFVFWLVPMALPLLILGWGGYRVRYGPPPGLFLWSVMGLSVAGIAGQLGMLATRRGRDWIFAHRIQLALCLITSALAIVLFDVGLNLTGRVPTVEQMRAKSLEYKGSVATRYRLIPKVVYPDGKTPIIINSRGYRGPEIAVPKPAGLTRIIIVGGSHVFDYYGENWPALVEERLRKADKSVEVINAGVPGHASLDALGKILADLWQLQPDIIVICNAWNDTRYFAELTPQVNYCDITNPTRMDWRINPVGLDRLLCYSSLYRSQRNWFAHIIVGEEGGAPLPTDRKVGTYGPLQYKLSLQTICDLGKNIGTEIILCKQARLPTANSSDRDRRRMHYEYIGFSHEEILKAMSHCDRIIEEVAAQKKCRVIDMSTPLTGKSDLFVDHIHFSPAGSHAAATVMADALRPLVK